MKIAVDDGGRTLPNEDFDCWVRSLSKVTDRPYGEVWKLGLSKYGRRLGQPVHFRSDEKCGRSSDFSEFGSVFRWKSLPHRPTVGELALGQGKFILDICCVDTWGGHHLVAAIDGTVFDNEEESVGLEDGTVVGYWRLDETAAALVASGTSSLTTRPPLVPAKLVAYPRHYQVKASVIVSPRRLG